MKLAKEEALPRGDLRLRAEIQEDKLSVTVVETRNLLAMNSNGKSDPYVKLIYLGKRQKTKVQKKTLNAKFDKSFTFELKEGWEQTSLYVAVWDWNATSHNLFIGEVVVDLKDVQKDTPFDKWLVLTSQNRRKEFSRKGSKSQSSSYKADKQAVMDVAISSVGSGKKSEKKMVLEHHFVSQTKNLLYIAKNQESEPSFMLNLYNCTLEGKDHSKELQESFSILDASSKFTFAGEFDVDEWRDSVARAKITPPETPLRSSSDATTAGGETRLRSSSRTPNMESPKNVIEKLAEKVNEKMNEKVETSKEQDGVRPRQFKSIDITQDLSSIHLIITPDEANSSLIVECVEATNIPGVDRSGTSDPYVKIRIAKEKRKTTVKKKTLSPVWNESLTWENLPSLPTELTVSIWDWNRSQRNTKIATCQFEIDTSKTTDAWFTLSPHERRGSRRRARSMTSSKSASEMSVESDSDSHTEQDSISAVSE